MNLALFDFDGTITTRGMYAPFLRFAAPRERLARGRMQLAPLFIGYKLGLVSGSAMRAAGMRVAFRDVAAERIRQAGLAFSRFCRP